MQKVDFEDLFGGIMFVVIITFVAVLTAVSAFSLIVFAYLGEWANIGTPIIGLIGTIGAFWLPMYLDRDEWK